jgi:methionine-rich copper-binding protein CopC
MRTGYRKPSIVRFAVVMAAFILAAIASPRVALAQAAIVSASPGPNQTVALPPPEVRLITNRPVIAGLSSIGVLDASGQAISSVTAGGDPDDPFAFVVSLPVLLEGQYTVNYQIATLGESTVLVGSYTFLLDLPDPILNLETPANGAGVPAGPVRLVMQSQFIDFSLYDRRIRVYVDGSQIAEIQSFRYVINDLEPGIHEIRTVLTQFENEELQNTSTTIYIAVAPQDPGQTGSSPIVDSPLDLSALQWAGLALGTMICLGIGFWLGRFPEHAA